MDMRGFVGAHFQIFGITDVCSLGVSPVLSRCEKQSSARTCPGSVGTAEPGPGWDLPARSDPWCEALRLQSWPSAVVLQGLSPGALLSLTFWILRSPWPPHTVLSSHKSLKENSPQSAALESWKPLGARLPASICSLYRVLWWRSPPGWLPCVVPKGAGSRTGLSWWPLLHICPM